MSNAIAMSLAVQPTSTVVVQNDNAAITPLAFVQPLTQVLADLETQRVVWEEGVYRTSDTALPKEVLGKPAQVWLADDKLQMRGL